MPDTVKVMTTEENISAYADPEGEAPWAMQIVVDVPKAMPPEHFEVLEAVAAAVVARIETFETGTTEQRDALARWRAGRIRKVVRRARGAAWDRAASTCSAVTHVGGIRVCVFEPGPTDQVPAEISKLQVGGFNLPANPAEDPDELVTLYLNPQLELSTGKAAAQVAHAAQLVFETAQAHQRELWASQDFGCHVRVACPTLWEQLKTTGQVHVVDAGFTEIDPGTMTVIARHTL